MKRPAVFLDRDGVLNKKPAPHDYVKDFSEFTWNKGAKELIQQLKSKGNLVIVVSNQQGISLGKITEEFVNKLHLKMNEDLKEQNVSIDAFYFCPHGVDDECDCRKPKPGLFFYAVNDFDIDLKNSFMIGDSEIDMIAAKEAGCKKSVIVKSDSIDIKYIMNEIGYLV